MAACEAHRYTAGCEPASYLSQGVTRRTPRQPPTASHREAFSFQGANQTHGRRTTHTQSSRSGSRSGRPSSRSRSTNPQPGAEARARTSTCSRCCRIRPAACTWGTSSTTRWVTSSRTSSAVTASPCCGRWASTRSACPPRTPRSRTAATRSRSPSATWRRSASRCAAWAGRSTGSARSPRTSRPSTAGRSGSS